MPLPHAFANLTSISAVFWDQDYYAVGANANLPNSTTGTNALALTQLANTIDVTAYQNYMVFTGIVAVSNTGAVTAQYGALAALNVYKDSAAGPVALTGGELIAGNAYALTYDSALNAGSGGFHLATGPVAGTGSFLPLAGGTITGNVTLSSTVALLSIPSGTISVAKLSINGAANITRAPTASASIVFTAIAPQTTQDQTIAVAGAQVGDVVALGIPSIASGLVFTGFISAASIATVRCGNVTSGTITPGGGTYRATALGYT